MLATAAGQTQGGRNLPKIFAKVVKEKQLYINIVSTIRITTGFNNLVQDYYFITI